MVELFRCYFLDLGVRVWHEEAVENPHQTLTNVVVHGRDDLFHTVTQKLNSRLDKCLDHLLNFLLNRCPISDILRHPLKP